MTVHQCPKCELKFDWKTEVDDHCWHDHPEFRHEYPAHAVEPPKPARRAPRRRHRRSCRSGATPTAAPSSAGSSRRGRTTIH